MEFPQYRKLTEKSYYRIDSETNWIELQVVGKKIFKNTFTASTFLDRNFIQDLLTTDNGRYTIISLAEFKKIETGARLE